MFKDSMQTVPDSPRFCLLYNQATLIEVDVLPWDVHPWEASELALVRAASHITVGMYQSAELTQFLLTENRKMRFGAFQLDEAGQIVFAHTILGGEDMDLLELQTCILSVAAIATTYDDIVSEKFGSTGASPRSLVEI
jgi:Putative bacterial sensory transduction regulator